MYVCQYFPMPCLVASYIFDEIQIAKNIEVTFDSYDTCSKFVGYNKRATQFGMFLSLQYIHVKRNVGHSITQSAIVRFSGSKLMPTLTIGSPQRANFFA